MDSNGVFAGVDDSLSGRQYKRKQAAEGRSGCHIEAPDDRFVEKETVRCTVSWRRVSEQMNGNDADKDINTSVLARLLCSVIPSH